MGSAGAQWRHGSPRVCLASKSPRRRELLAQLGVPHECLDIEVEERWDGRSPPGEHVLRLALEKARRGWRQCLERGHPCLVIAGDTEVVLAGCVLGKAERLEAARAMLGRLSGCSHLVYSAVALVDTEGAERSALNVTRVSFRTLTPEEIEAYCASGEPLGKAGGYAIQGRAAAFIERIEGSYSAVVGLPLYETAELLRQAGIR